MASNPQHPNAATDPDCTSRDALEEGLQIRIAAELYHRVLAVLRSDTAQKFEALQFLLQQTEKWQVELDAKYDPLRKIIGLLPKGESDDS